MIETVQLWSDHELMMNANCRRKRTQKFINKIDSAGKNNEENGNSTEIGSGDDVSFSN